MLKCIIGFHICQDVYHVTKDNLVTFEEAREIESGRDSPAVAIYFTAHLFPNYTQTGCLWFGS
jgi:hypothetical protein